MVYPKKSVYLYAQQGKSPRAIKSGRHWCFRWDMVEAWIDEQTKPQMAVKERI